MPLAALARRGGHPLGWFLVWIRKELEGTLCVHWQRLWFAALVSIEMLLSDMGSKRSEVRGNARGKSMKVRIVANQSEKERNIITFKL